MSDYLDEISAFICRCQFDDLASAVVECACQVMADTLGVIAAGAQEDEIRVLTDRMVASGGKRVSTVIGSGIRTEPSKAALINGTAGTSLELDAGSRFARGHPAIHAVPAALAVAEEMNLSGPDLLTALVLGYEIGARIGIASRLRISMHSHGTWGTVGAAVAVGKLKGLDERAMREIINVSSSLGLATSSRTMLEGGTVRNVYAGVSGYMGILAYDLVRSGFTGEKDGLQTIFSSVASEAFVPEMMTKELGSRFEIARSYFKRHACCRHCHATLDALGSIVTKRFSGRIEPDEIMKVEVTTYSFAARLCDQNPRNKLASKFSIPFAVASFIFNGHAGVSSFTSQTVINPDIRALAQKVTVTEDPSMTAMMPDRRPSRVRVILNDGTISEGETFISKGDAEDPYSPEEMKEKYYGLVSPIWGNELAEEVYTDMLTLDKVKNINHVTRKMNIPAYNKGI